MTEIDERVGRLCALLAESDLGPACQAADAHALLRAVVTAVRADAPEEELTVALDALDARMAASDYGFVTRMPREYRRLPGDRSRLADVRVCPARRACARTIRVRDGDPGGATCALTGEAMPVIRLHS